MANRRVAVGITGASGVIYGLRLIAQLLGRGCRVELMISKAAQMVLATETDLKLPGRPEDLAQALRNHFGGSAEQLAVYAKEQWTAPIASGSGAPQAMVVCPCTSGTLAAIASGASNNLLERAADVMLKEQRKLILVTRETPLSAIHLENMLKLARLGVTILPASPGFYHRPQTIEQLADFVVARVLDHLQIEHDLVPRWGSDDSM